MKFVGFLLVTSRPHSKIGLSRIYKEKKKTKKRILVLQSGRLQQQQQQQKKTYIRKRNALAHSLANQTYTCKYVFENANTHIQVVSRFVIHVRTYEPSELTAATAKRTNGNTIKADATIYKSIVLQSANYSDVSTIYCEFNTVDILQKLSLSKSKQLRREKKYLNIENSKRKRRKEEIIHHNSAYYWLRYFYTQFEKIYCDFKTVKRKFNVFFFEKSKKSKLWTDSITKRRGKKIDVIYIEVFQKKKKRSTLKLITRERT